MKYRFAIIGSGWRAEFFLRCARYLPDLLQVCALSCRSEEKRQEYQDEYGIRVYETYEQLLAVENPDFVVVSVAGAAISEITLGILELGVAVLAETHPMTTAELTDFYKRIPRDARLQVAEQYFLQPYHQAVLDYISSGRLGAIAQTRISFTQTYHALSLMRKYLGIGFENAKISGRQFEVPGYPGFGRAGEPAEERLEHEVHSFAFFDFGGQVGIYDFETNQHRSWIRSSNIVIKGTKGQIENERILYLQDYRTPMDSRFIRKNKGELINMEGQGLKGIIAEGNWCYKNPYPEARFSDEEIAVAQCLCKMGHYVHTGEEFYSFAEAAQDCYLAHVMELAVESGRVHSTETQIWAADQK